MAPRKYSMPQELEDERSLKRLEKLPEDETDSRKESSSSSSSTTASGNNTTGNYIKNGRAGGRRHSTPRTPDSPNRRATLGDSAYEWETLENGARQDSSSYLQAYNEYVTKRSADGAIAGSATSLHALGYAGGRDESKRKAASLSFIGDSASTANSIIPDMTPEEREGLLWRNITRMGSCIYAVLVIIVGGIFYISDLRNATSNHTEVFASSVALIGIFWLAFIHVDLHRYKRYVVSQLKLHEETLQEMGDRISTTTEVIFNTAMPVTTGSPPYRFLRGRHSGSFYLKAGMAAFCFGHIIHEGLRLGQHVLYLTDRNMDLKECTNYYAISVHVIRLVYSFYQLFMIFKYSNIVINRYKELARFGLMHCIGTSVCFWFGAIIEDAIEDYQEKHGRIVPMSTIVDADSNDTYSEKINYTELCANNSILSKQSLNAIPYLYPFTIEYNLLLAGVWFIVWQNIGNENSPHANPHHFQHKISSDDGTEEITYQSNLTISADCHAANRGLFAGLSILLSAIITVIVFFVTMSKDNYVHVGLAIYDIQEGTLNILALLSMIVAYRQISQLDFNLHPITFLDDVLLFIPLPFFFVNTILSIMAESNHEGGEFRVALNVIVTLQVIIQTPFIIDGLRRCSNSHASRFKKPGREIITFSIILNLTMWIVSTFEHKSVEPYHAERLVYGPEVWMYIGHTTLPLMLFYRFHSSVCLADIWKSAYEKGE